MAVFTTAKTMPVDPAAKMKELGIFASRAGNVALDQYFTEPGKTFQEYAKYIIPGTTGDLILENINGIVSWHPNKPASYILPFVCQRVLSSFTFPDIGAKTTTATNIIWMGGM